MRRAVLALDQGSHASRACLFDEHGALRAVASVDVATQHPGAGLVEQDPVELLASLYEAAEQCLSAAPELRVETAGLATQRSSLLCCQRQSLTPLSAVLSWQDRRNAVWLTTVARQEAQIRTVTGLPLSPHYGASKMRWCLDHLPAAVAARQQGQLCFAPLASWLAARLGGGPLLADPANAARTLLFDSALLDWSPALLKLFDIQRAELPLCARTDAAFGELSVNTLAVPTRIPLRAVSGDQSAVPFAFGRPDEHTAYINLGTGAFIQRPLAQRPVQTAPLLGSVLAATSERCLYSLEGTVNGAGSAVSWLMAERQLEQATLWVALENLHEGTLLPVFLNGVGGLGSPWWQPHLQSRFEGSGTALECFAAVLESVVFMLAGNFRLLAAHGPPLRQVLVSGGMSRSNWLCRRLAATLGVPVLRVAAEATGRGIAALAAPQLSALWPPVPRECFEPQSMNALRARQVRFEALVAAAITA
jgi:glycerol kinase